MSEALSPLPLVSHDIPGTGGAYKTLPEDFMVEEIPRYEPSGEGAHLYLLVEKTDLPAKAVPGQIARVLEGERRSVGTAGNKDTRARTIQWVSILDEAKRWNPDSDDIAGLPWHEKIRILKVSRHTNRLKTGHLLGNRFTITLRGVEPGSEERARQVLDLLATRGMLNFYGEQRFGHGGGNIDLGLAWLRGEDTPEVRRAKKDRFLKKLIPSALQAWLFNEVLKERIARGDLYKVLEGDVLSPRLSRATFHAEDLETEQARLDAGDVVHTGPMFGPKGKRPRGAADALEQSVLERHEVKIGDFSCFGKFAQGTRRANLVFPTETSVETCEEGLRLRFSLPRGSYATVLLNEVIQNHSQE